MKRIVLHIGTHKTGSSALQEVFEDSRPALAEHGIWYPSTNREPRPNLPKHTSLYHTVVRKPDGFADEIRLMRDEAQAAGCETLLISEEGFSEPSFEAFEIFRTLPSTCQVDIYCYLRRQDLFLESLWNQYAREGRERRSIAAFVDAPRFRLRGDYERMLDFWSRVGTVHAAGYDEARKEGISGHFAGLAGLPDLPKAKVANPSLGMNAALVHTWFNRLKQVPPAALLEALEGDTRRHALGRTLRQKVLAAYLGINRAVLERYGVAFPAGEPEEPANPLVAPDPAFLVPLLTHLAAGKNKRAALRDPA